MLRLLNEDGEPVGFSKLLAIIATLVGLASGLGGFFGNAIAVGQFKQKVEEIERTVPAIKDDLSHVRGELRANEEWHRIEGERLRRIEDKLDRIIENRQ
jgi:hypothetical protein